MIECVDSIVSPQTTGQPIPAAVLQAPAVLAYNHGNSWPTYGPYVQARPDLARKGWIISTTLTCLGSARCYDIEPGGGQNRNIGVFMRNADRTHGLPILYTFASNVAAMIAAAASFGFHQGRDYFVLAAHPNSRFGRHVCAPTVCGYPRADGTQYAFQGDIDRSSLNDYMLPQPAKPKPPPAPADPTGRWNFTGYVDMPKGDWHITGAPGAGVKMGGHNRRWRGEISVGEQHGDWQAKGLPFG